MAFSDYQLGIYFQGLTGVISPFPMDYASLETRASAAMSDGLLSYYAGGCGDNLTQRANVEAFSNWGLVPRMLVGATERDTTVDLFGIKLPFPMFMAPIGVIGLCSQDGHGDIATAQAAAQTGVPMVASTLTQDPMEEVASHLGDAPGFYQLYTPKDRELALSFISRAEQAGFQGIVVTLDTWIPGWRPRDLAMSNMPQLRGHALANYTSDPRFKDMLPEGKKDDLSAIVGLYGTTFGHSVCWDDLGWLREATKLPMLLKGICDPEDAKRALDAGMDGIYCSNHGGRQANGGLPALDVLPDVVAACGDAPVLFDSGVRSGADVLKALAMGATAVGIGRPYGYALALDGVPGLVHLLRSFMAEADLIMAVDGYKSIADLTPDALRRVIK